MPVELGYFTLQVKDIGRAKRFYGALFGWEFDKSPKGAHVKNTKLPIGLDPGGPTNISFAYFRVQDISTAMKQIAALGGEVRDQSKVPLGLWRSAQTIRIPCSAYGKRHLASADRDENGASR